MMSMNDTLKLTHIGLYIYHSFFLLMYVLAGLCFVVAIPLGMLSDSGESEPPPAWFALLCGGFFAIFFLIFILFHVIGLITVRRRTRGAWILQIVLVAFGFSSLLTVIPSVLLLVGLISQDVQDYYKYPYT